MANHEMLPSLQKKTHTHTHTHTHTQREREKNAETPLLKVYLVPLNTELTVCIFKMFKTVLSVVIFFIQAIFIFLQVSCQPCIKSQNT